MNGSCATFVAVQHSAPTLCKLPLQVFRRVRGCPGFLTLQGGSPETTVIGNYIFVLLLRLYHFPTALEL